MSIIVRKTGTREYAYAAHRDGKRMVQEYMGPLARPEVRRRVELARRATVIPAHTMRLFEDVASGGLSLQRNGAQIIARILEAGDLDDADWMTYVFPASAIVDVLLSADLTPRTRNFWLVWFEVPDAS